MLAIMTGLPGTGKTTISLEAARILGGTCLNKDLIRAALFQPEDIEYSDAQDDFCIDVMLDTAGFLFRRNPDRILFLDGRTFTLRYQQDHVVAIAEHHGWPWVMFECVCSDETARSRLHQSAATHIAANRTFDLYQTLKRKWETAPYPTTVLDTDHPLLHSVDRAVRVILERLQPSR